jgi:hypothetical protein
MMRNDDPIPERDLTMAEYGFELRESIQETTGIGLRRLDWFACIERGALACSIYVLVRKICGHLRERSAFAAICVGTFVPVLKDCEWARMGTNGHEWARISRALASLSIRLDSFHSRLKRIPKTGCGERAWRPVLLFFRRGGK